MSHVALQRVIVRMLYDPEFTARIMADPATMLAHEALTAEERAWLLQPDPRAWTVDPERPARSLGSLLQRYPTSASVAARSAGSIEPLRRFFRSERFHRSIQERGSMAIAFGEHLAELVQSGEIEDRRALALARLEQAIVELHRMAHSKPPSRTPDAAAYRISPDARLHRAPLGTADLHETIHRLLLDFGQGLVGAIIDTSRRLPAGAIDFARDEPLILELVRRDSRRAAHLVGTTEITENLYALLAFAASQRSREELEAEVIRLGAGPDDAAAVIAGLIGDGTLVPS
jgi:hypothetical protein